MKYMCVSCGKKADKGFIRKSKELIHMYGDLQGNSICLDCYAAWLCKTSGEVKL